MQLHLMQLRKRAGYKSRDVFADEIGVNRHTYKSRETGTAKITLEQAYRCAVALDCTIDEIAGLEHPPLLADPHRVALMRYYDAMDEEGHAILAESARLMSGGANARP